MNTMTRNSLSALALTFLGMLLICFGPMPAWSAELSAKPIEVARDLL
jgi:hypothetical protein